MSELPNGWETIALREIAARGTRTIDPSCAPEEEFELYSVPAFSAGNPETRLGGEIKSVKQIVREGDVLLCKIVPHINRVWTVGQYNGRRQVASGEWIVYRDHHCDPSYLRALLSEGEFRERFLTTVSGVGGSLMRANPKAVAEFEVPLAPVDEQRRIVAKIDSLSAKSARARDHLDHIPRLVEKYKQAVLGAAFRGDLTREWRQSHPVQEDASAYLLKRQAEHISRQCERGRGRDERAAQIALDEELRDKLAELSVAQPLPSTWCWASLGLAFGIYVGATPSRKEPRFWNGTVPWASSGEVAFCTIRDTAESITELGLEQTSTRLHPQGTLLIGMIGEGKTRGQVAILELEAANNQNCAAIRVSEAAYPVYYVYWYLWKSYAETRRVGSGNNQQALNKERVQRIAFPLAPPKEAEEIARQIAQISEWIDRLAKEATSARKLIDRLDQAILAKAFRGELVPQDPADEPASVLLERIRAERAGAPAAKRRGRPRAPALP